MSDGLLLGLDIGLTVSKAVVFDLRGCRVASARRENENAMPARHQVERDPEAFWATVATIIRDAVSGMEDKIVAVGIAAHGDGAWLVDESGVSVRPAILSLDSRAHDESYELSNGDRGRRLQALIGQRPWPASPGSVLLWLQRNEPGTLDRARWLLATKDYIRLRLTGQAATDFTEASSAFADVNTQCVTPMAFELQGLVGLEHLIPPVFASYDVAGVVNEAASAATGLAVGTPVVAGLHDVDAGALGVGSVHAGDVTVIAGSWSVNQVISDRPALDDRWITRSFVERGRWMCMAASPASSTNLEWFARSLCGEEMAAARAEGRDPFGFVDREVSAVDPTDDAVYFLPYLYGSPMERDASATFAGVRAWHTRGHLLRGVYEGIAFNHWYHLSGLLDTFEGGRIKVMGGVSRSPLWQQLLTDLVGREIEVSGAPEPGALGAAICAAVGAGRYGDFIEAADGMVGPCERITPLISSHVRLRRRYADYIDLVGTLRPWWDRLEENLGAASGGRVPGKIAAVDPGVRLLSEVKQSTSVSNRPN